MAILKPARCAAHMWGALYTLCIYLHFKIVLNKFKRLADKLKSFPPSLLLALETVSLSAIFFDLQYWPVNLFIVLKILQNLFEPQTFE